MKFSSQKKAVTSVVAASIVLGLVLVALSSNSASPQEVELFGPLSFMEVNTHILNMKMRRSEASERLKEAALLKRQQQLEAQNAKADQSLGSDDSITDNTMAMSMGGDSPQAPPQRARSPAPRAAAHRAHSAATIQTVQPLAMAAPAPKVQLSAVQNSAQFHDSSEGKVQERSMAADSERAYEAFVSHQMGGGAPPK